MEGEPGAAARDGGPEAFAPRARVIRLPGASRPSSLARDARVGFARTQKELPPKYFYDARGSALFERICATPEYYPTRTESRLLAAAAPALLADLRPDTLVELGSGSSEKTCHFFSACEASGHRLRYQPLDVCAEALECAAERLSVRFPWLAVEALCGDYSLDLAALPKTPGRRLFLFLGGTLGNLTQAEAQAFLARLRAVMRPDEALLLGFDRVKDISVLNAAYNDAEGVTAAFNLNLLRVLNARLGAQFDTRDFAHGAWFNPDESQIEMHLIAQRAHAVAIPGIERRVAFCAGESIRTEISRKFTPETMQALLAASGFACERHIEPENGYFSLALARPH